MVFIKSNQNIFPAVLFSALLFVTLSCHKKENSPAPQSDTTPSNEILTDLATNVIYGVNLDLYTKTVSLDSAMNLFSATPNAASLISVKNVWFDARKRYELSEAVVFGPSLYLNVDPNLDTWPVDTNGLNQIVNGTDVLTSAYVSNLDPTLKGFHVIEFFLFGSNGQKQAAQFSMRQLQFLTALTSDAKTNAGLLKSTWNPLEGNYVTNFTYAGTTDKSSYASQKAAFQEIVGSMQGIVDQISNEKIEGAISPTPDPNQQESRYSNNTMTDLVNDIQGVKNVYLGKYIIQGKGVHDWVMPRNAKLDSTISSRINLALTSLSDISCSFTDAIYPSSPCNAQLKAAKTNLDSLNSTLKSQLIPFINTSVNN